MDEEKGSRIEKSLSTLTRKFVELLQESDELDLNMASTLLEVTKKRRIYDITNVLEGINLIKKVSKNQFKWVGKSLTGNQDPKEAGQLEEAQFEKDLLETEEQQLNQDIEGMKIVLNSMHAQKSYCYVTRQDLVAACGEDETILVAREYKHIKFQFQMGGEVGLGDVEVVGDVVRPAELKMVNPEASLPSNSDFLFYLEGDNDIKMENAETQKHYFQRGDVPKSFNINLFRQRLKPIPFFDLDENERIKLASILDVDKHKDKSFFHFISTNSLVKHEDYVQPDFIDVQEPPDTDYHLSYSIEPPSIHDLFDLDLNEIRHIDGEDYEMEYLEEEVVEDV